MKTTSIYDSHELQDEVADVRDMVDSEAGIEAGEHDGGTR